MGLFSKGRSRSSSTILDPRRAAQSREQASVLALRGLESARGGDWGEAARCLERAVETMRPAAGPDDMEFARLLNNWANALQMDGRLDQALPLYEESIEIKRAASGDGDAEVLSSLRNLLAALEAREDWSQAGDVASTIVECLEASGRADHLEFLFALEKAASLRSQAGESDEAGELRSIAVQHVLKNGTPSRLDVAALCEDLAEAIGQAGDEATAEALLQRSLDAREALEGRRTLRATAILRKMAHHALALGDRETARDRFAEVLEIRLDKLGPRHPDAIESMNDLAGVFLADGENARALALFERVLHGREESSGIDHPSYAYALNNLAGACWAVGDERRAAELYEEFRQRMEALDGRGHPFYASATANLGKLALDRGDPLQAESALEEAIRQRLELEGQENPETARIWETLADAQVAMGLWDQALEIRRRALDVRRDAQGELHPAYIGSLCRLANLLQERGEIEDARELIAEASRWTGVSLGGRHLAMVLVMGRAARLDRAAGVFEAAAALARGALNPEGTRLGLELPFLPTIRWRAALVEIQKLLRLIIDAGSRGDWVSEFCLANYLWIIRWKGIAGSSARVRRLAARDSTIRDAALRLQALRDQMERVGRGVSPIPEDQLGPMESKAQEWEAALASRTGWSGDGPELATILETLPDGWALVDWVQGDSRTSAFVIRHDREIQRVDWDDSKAIARAIDEWRAAASPDNARTACARLSELIAKPLEEPLRDARGLAIAPDGDGRALPWHGLDWGDRELVLLDSVREWIERESEVRDHIEPRVGLLASGAVDPRSASASAISASPIARFDPSLGQGLASIPRPDDLDPSPLEGAEAFAEELTALADRHPDYGGVAKRLGAQASRIGVLTALAETRDLCLLHRIAVKPPSTSGPDPADPLWLDGQGGRWSAALVCSGAAELTTEPLTGMIEASASLIEADDIVKLDLSHCRLVVLIAPPGRLGAEGAGELARAFRDAGARHTLLALQRDSPDEAGWSETLRRFFVHLIEEHQPPSSALRLAVAEVGPEFAARVGWGLWTTRLEGRTSPRALARLECSI